MTIEIEGLPELGLTGAGFYAFRLLAGPSLSAVGKVFGEWTEMRLRNVMDIDEKIRARLPDDAADTDLTVPPHVLHEVLSEGSWISDDVQQEYLAGLLIASRAPMGKQDSSAYYVRMVTGLTPGQIRLHNAIYYALADSEPFDIGLANDAQLHAVWAPQRSAVGLLQPEGSDSLEATIIDAALGLDRLDLTDTLSVASAEVLSTAVDRVPQEACMIFRGRPSGAVLYMRAHGLATSDADRLFELGHRSPIGPTFDQVAISPVTSVPAGM